MQVVNVGFDADGALNDLAFSLVEGGNSPFFVLESNGALAFKDAPDYENSLAADGSHDYRIQVKINDGALESTQPITVTVQNVNDNAPRITSSDSLVIPAGVACFALLTAEDADHDKVAFMLEGVDAGAFEIRDDSLCFVGQTLTDDYHVELQAGDGTLSTTQNVNVHVEKSPEPTRLQNNRQSQSALYINGNVLHWYLPPNVDAGTLRLDVIGVDGTRKFHTVLDPYTAAQLQYILPAHVSLQGNDWVLLRMGTWSAQRPLAPIQQH